MKFQNLCQYPSPKYINTSKDKLVTTKLEMFNKAKVTATNRASFLVKRKVVEVWDGDGYRLNRTHTFICFFLTQQRRKKVCPIDRSELTVKKKKNEKDETTTTTATAPRSRCRHRC